MRARDLPEDEQAVVEAVAHWVDREVHPPGGSSGRRSTPPR
jgi:hypothetical protein